MIKDKYKPLFDYYQVPYKKVAKVKPYEEVKKAKDSKKKKKK